LRPFRAQKLTTIPTWGSKPQALSLCRSAASEVFTATLEFTNSIMNCRAVVCRPDGTLKCLPLNLMAVTLCVGTQPGRPASWYTKSMQIIH
ncbi:MAG: hypothetical protein GY795_43655, partial [Desulfobacterales bacterium]|nr:hypothetical protein [Desulfobacterales bacterium]